MLDLDTTAVTEALDSAQKRSGLDQAAFACALGTSASRYSTYRTGKVAPSAAFLMRAVRIADALETSRKRGVPTAPSASASIREALSHRENSWAFSLALEARDRADDTIRHRPELSAGWEAGARIGDRKWDTLFAAIIGHAFERNDSERPRWTYPQPLDEKWAPVVSIRYSETEAEQQTPSWLRTLNIIVADRDLSTL